MNDRLDPPDNRGPSGWAGSNWRRDGARPAADETPRNSLERFLGGSPAAVFVRLLAVSVVVGALLMWLDIRPADIFYAVNRFINRLWLLGFDAVRELAQYVLVGAMIVVPIWLIMRIFNSR